MSACPDGFRNCVKIVDCGRFMELGNNMCVGRLASPRQGETHSLCFTDIERGTTRILTWPVGLERMLVFLAAARKIVGKKRLSFSWLDALSERFAEGRFDTEGPYNGRSKEDDTEDIDGTLLFPPKGL